MRSPCSSVRMMTNCPAWAEAHMRGARTFILKTSGAILSFSSISKVPAKLLPFQLFLEPLLDLVYLSHELGGDVVGRGPLQVRLAHLVAEVDYPDRLYVAQAVL